MMKKRKFSADNAGPDEEQEICKLSSKRKVRADQKRKEKKRKEKSLARHGRDDRVSGWFETGEPDGVEGS